MEKYDDYNVEDDDDGDANDDDNCHVLCFLHMACSQCLP